MKITKLSVKNIQRVRHVEIIAKPYVNELAGRNEQGKTSIADAIRMVFDGAKAITENPLRNGEAEGEVVAETEEFTARRTFRRNGASQLKVTRNDGKPMGQNGLWDLLSPFSFDPLAFSRMKPKEQAEAVNALIPQDVRDRIKAYDADIAASEAARGDAKRDLARIGAIAMPEPVERVDVSAISLEMGSIEERNRERDALESERARASAGLEGLQARISDARRMLAGLEHERDSLMKRLDGLPPAEPRESMAALQERLAIAGAQNRRAEEYDAAKTKIEAQRTLSGDLLEIEKRISSLRALRGQLLATGFDLGVPGVEFGDDGIRVDGHPWSMLCASKKLRVSALIGAAASGGLRIMRVDDGSLLDSDSYAEMKKIAEERDLQIWVETVGSGHGEAIIIDDGMVLDADGEF
jgi:DNA repair exonuclease SbcCD ATPase subunit